MRKTRIMSLAVISICTVALSSLGHGESIDNAATVSFVDTLRITLPITELRRKIGRTEIGLFVRTEQSPWHFLDSLTEEEDNFEYQARKDGKYWFAARYPRLTRTSSDEVVFAVVVDRSPPKLLGNITVDEQGRISLVSSIEDEHLDWNTLVLEYRLDDDQVWRKLHPSALEVKREGLTTGRVTAEWRPNESYVKASVRLYVADLAGKKSVVLGQVTCLRAQNPTTINQEGLEIGNSSKPRTQSSQLATWTSKAPTFNHPLSPSDPKSFPRVVLGKPLPLLGSPDLNLEKNFASGVISQVSSLELPYILASTSTRQAQGRTLQDHGRTIREYKNSRGLPDSKAEPRSSSKQMSLQYSFDNIDQDSVRWVKIWATSDRGKTWIPAAIDVDCVSPCEVMVPNDGNYGFCLQFATDKFGETNAPQPGQKADISILVDSVGLHQVW